MYTPKLDSLSFNTHSLTWLIQLTNQQTDIHSLTTINSSYETLPLGAATATSPHGEFNDEYGDVEDGGDVVTANLHTQNVVQLIHCQSSQKWKYPYKRQHS